MWTRGLDKFAGDPWLGLGNLTPVRFYDDTPRSVEKAREAEMLRQESGATVRLLREVERQLNYVDGMFFESGWEMVRGADFRDLIARMDALGVLIERLRATRFVHPENFRHFVAWAEGKYAELVSKAAGYAEAPSLMDVYG